MPSKPEVKKETNSAAKETARPVRKAAPRVSTAKHRTAKSTETPLSAETPGIEATTETTTANSRELIAAIAYGYWEARGYQGGDPLEDWVRAEAECNARAIVALKTAAAAV